MATRRSTRKRKNVCYNEDALAKKSEELADVATASTGTGKKKYKGRSTAQEELKGKAPYRGGASKKGPTATISSETMSLPKRNKQGQLVFPDFPEFRPNLTPKQVLHLGSFGGTYFRPIKSAVTGESYKANVHKEFPDDWFEGLDVKTQVTARTYDKDINKYNVKCGGSLDMWESSGWISSIDPYGWFHWYCRFYLGRRSGDDARQIGRGARLMGNKGRFRNQLIGRCARNGKRFDDASVSPVIRQTLQHWGYVLTQKDADAYVKRKKLPKLPR